MSDLALDEFVSSIQDSIIEFKEDYLKNHNIRQDDYPLVMTEDNTELWVEWFFEFIQRGI